MDNIIFQIKYRAADSTGRIPVKSLYSDKNFLTLQGAIQDRSHYLDSPGVISNPGLCVSGLTVYFNDFVCFAPGGIFCDIPSGNVGLSPANPDFDRIDLVTVDPLVQYDADGEINYSGEIQVVTGLATGVQMPQCPLTELKIGEIDVPAGITDLTLRDWLPNYVQESMLKPNAQNPPGMTIDINPFRGFVGTCCCASVFQGGTAAFSQPGDCCVHRIDLVTLTPGLSVKVTAGLSVIAPIEPVAPCVTLGEIPVAQVYLFGEQDYVSQAEILDIRPAFTGLYCI